MRVAVSALDCNNELLDQQESQETSKGPHSNCHLGSVTVTMFTVVMTVVVGVSAVF